MTAETLDVWQDNIAVQVASEDNTVAGSRWVAELDFEVGHVQVHCVVAIFRRLGCSPIVAPVFDFILVLEMGGGNIAWTRLDRLPSPPLGMGNGINSSNNVRVVHLEALS